MHEERRAMCTQFQVEVWRTSYHMRTLINARILPRATLYGRDINKSWNKAHIRFVKTIIRRPLPIGLTDALNRRRTVWQEKVCRIKLLSVKKEWNQMVRVILHSENSKYQTLFIFLVLQPSRSILRTGFYDNWTLPAVAIMNDRWTFTVTLKSKDKRVRRHWAATGKKELSLIVTFMICALITRISEFVNKAFIYQKTQFPV